MPAAQGDPKQARPPGLAEFIRFVATGSVAAVSNLIAAWVFRQFLPFEVGVTLGYIVGMVVAFILFQKLIFADPGTPIARRIFRFTVVNLIGLGIAVLVSKLMLEVVLPAIGWTLFPAETANFVGVAVPAFSSYFLHKYYTYK